MKKIRKSRNKEIRMSEKFFGTTSSKLAKERYVPVNSDTAKRNLPLGANTTEIFLSDPKLLGFTASKHKFVGKMFEGFDSVLEIGCMDGFGSVIVSDFVGHLTSIDYFRDHIDQAKQNVSGFVGNIEFKGHDFLDGESLGQFDGCFALDVLEHIDPEQEGLFLKKVQKSLKDEGVFIVGMPSLESQAYASKTNLEAHINCQSAGQLTQTLRQYFSYVFPFGMNDEVLHTGYSKMCQYIFNVCAGSKNVAKR